MSMNANALYLLLGIGAFVFALLVISAFTSGSNEIQKRLERVGSGRRRDVSGDRISPNSVRSTKDSAIPLLDQLIKLLPNPDKLRSRLSRTGHNIALGEYLLMNALSLFVSYTILNLFSLSKPVVVLLSIMVGLGLPHMVTGIMGAKRIKKFLASFPVPWYSLWFTYHGIDRRCRTRNARSCWHRIPPH
jgi:tight adherence protein B